MTRFTSSKETGTVRCTKCRELVSGELQPAGDYYCKGHEQLNMGAVIPRFYDVNGREITDGCVIWNPSDRNPEQSVKLIEGELWFGAKGTTPNKNNDWCKLDKRYRTEKFWLIVS